ncbi:MAG: hypothetical protein ACLTRS_05675 [Lachnospiraceae bacterium]
MKEKAMRITLTKETIEEAKYILADLVLCMDYTVLTHGRQRQRENGLSKEYAIKGL